VNFDTCKLCGTTGCLPKYTLRDFCVPSCPSCDFHTINYLDVSQTDPRQPDANAVRYIRTQLEHNHQRSKEQADLCESTLGNNLKVLDIGCGGGAFMEIMKKRGHRTVGIELNPARRNYCQSIGLDVLGSPIESWSETPDQFDLITLWDVIEHVNYPRTTIEATFHHLEKGGALILDTPSRDALFYRAGELTYQISGRLFPTFLATMYSAKPFAHKQIFSDEQIEHLLQ
jgi:2-polyprenyl-6-hydroxyphenyl methylase/3-demethylubiquinone-9 3-methyltransferase